MNPLPIQRAFRVADRIVAALAPYCRRIEIAGSIRRGRPTVGDIDLVALPHPGQLEGLLSRARAHCQVVTSGPQATVLTMQDGTQVDLWIAHADDDGDLFRKRPSNWGTLLLCRTGSKDHNVWLASRAKAMGLHWQPHQGVLRGEDVVASREESDVYAALGLPWIPPVFRHPPIAPEYLVPAAPAPAPAAPAPVPLSPQEGAAWFAKARARLEAVQSGAGDELARRLLAPSS